MKMEHIRNPGIKQNIERAASADVICWFREYEEKASALSKKSNRGYEKVHGCQCISPPATFLRKSTREFTNTHCAENLQKKSYISKYPKNNICNT